MRAASVRSFAADRGPAGLEALTAECAARAQQQETEERTKSRVRREEGRDVLGSASAEDDIETVVSVESDDIDWLTVDDDF